MSARDLEVRIVGDPSSLKRAFGEIHESGQKLHGWLTGAFTVGLAGAAAGVGAFGAAAKIGWGEYNQGAKVGAQTNAVIKSTGDVSHVSAKHVEELGTSLMKKSGVDDEVVKSGENMLLTFTNIRNESGKGNKIFDESTKTLTDMSVALGQDMPKSAIQLGKALNDPIAGVGALSRVGVTFTDGQKQAIKAMVDSGNTMGAQKLILHELNKEFGGSAEAAGKTLPGQLQILKQEFNNWAGDMVAKVVPVLTDFVSFARDHMPEVKRVIGDVFQHISEVFVATWPTIKLALEAAWVFFRDNLLPILKQLGDIFVTTVQNIAAVVQQHMPEIRRILGFVGEVIKDIAKVAIPLLKFAFEVVLPAAISVAIFALDKITTALHGIFTVVGAVAGWFKRLPGDIADAITGSMGDLWGALKSIFDPGVWKKKILGFLGFSSPSPFFVDIGRRIIDSIAHGVGHFSGVVWDAVKKIVGELNPFRGGLGGTGVDVGGLPVAGGVDMKDTLPRVQKAVAYAQKHGWHGEVTSGYRTYAQQAALYDNYIHHGGPLAAPPGHSSHEQGAAVDVTDYGTFGRIMASAPENERLFNFLGARDPVHYSITGYGTGGIAGLRGPELAVLGENGPEAVIPLSRPEVAAPLSRGLGAGGDIHVHVEVNGPTFGGNRRQIIREFIDDIVGELALYQRSGGTIVVSP